MRYPLHLVEKQFYTDKYNELYTIDEESVMCEVVEPTYNEDGTELTPRMLSEGTPTIEQYFEFFTPNEDGDAHIASVLVQRAKEDAEEEIKHMTVTTSSGKEFDANELARINMMSAVISAEFAGLTETSWRLTNNETEVVSLVDMKEAVMLALMKFGQLKGIGK